LNLDLSPFLKLDSTVTLEQDRPPRSRLFQAQPSCKLLAVALQSATFEIAYWARSPHCRSTVSFPRRWAAHAKLPIPV